MVTIQEVYAQLKTVLDPELHVNIVDLGLIYDVSTSQVQEEDEERIKIHIVMTLTSPGCPLSSVFDRMMKDALAPLAGINPERDVTVELTFDPPWVMDMMEPEVRAQLGL